jgi:hypothetical protein
MEQISFQNKLLENPLLIAAAGRAAMTPLTPSSLFTHRPSVAVDDNISASLKMPAQ